MNPMEAAVTTSDQVVNILPPAMHRDPGSARLELAAWDALHREEKQAVYARHRYLYTAGRLLIAALFLVMGVSKVFHFDETVATVAAGGYGSTSLLIGAALAIELIGGALLALGWKVRTTAGTLIGYLVLVTVLLAWDQRLAVNRDVAFTSLGYIGALLLLVSHGAGGVSLERYLSRSRNVPATVLKGLPK